MTARVTTLKGSDAGAYYVDRLPSYYLESEEPKGVWHGRGAARLGLTGEVDDDAFLAVMAGLDPTRPEEWSLGRPYDDRSVRAFDVTASAPKSVSVLFAVGDDRTRTAVLAAHDAAVAAMIGWVEDHAHTRRRIGGQVCTVDAEGLIVAGFRQHTSRALDPQLHTHVVIANRVRSDDGRWLALDARTLKMDQRTLSALYHATLRAELSARLPVRWEPVVNGIAEISRFPEPVLEEFSSRTAEVHRRVDEKLDRFLDTMGRDPTARERWRLEREAVVDSRPAKATSVDTAVLHADWHERLAALDVTPQQLVRGIANRTPLRELTPVDETVMIDTAMAALAGKQSSWRPAEITRELAAAIPEGTLIPTEGIVGLCDRLTARAIAERCVDLSRPVPDGAGLRRDGRPVTEAAIDRALSTPAIMAQEESLMAWAQRRFTRVGVDSAFAADRSPVPLTVPQAEVAAATAGDADLVLVVGPAGTGKTTALAPAVAQLQAEGRPVFGVAPSATAADVLGGETGVAADTLDKLLYEHSLHRPPDHRYDLPVGATVIVDEAAMVPTEHLARLAALADDKGWRIALVGDPQQFSAVGRGGMFQLLVDTHDAIELDTVHRFRHAWERDASLALRRGDPDIAAVYDEHHRLHGGTASRMQTEALAVWWGSRQAGKGVLLCAPTNDTVRQLNHAAQKALIDAGEIDTKGRHVDANGYRFHAGDEIVTRHNDRMLRTDRGLAVHNRDTWTVDTVHRNGDLTATGNTGTVRLPGHYVAQHVELGYAQTSHGAQGRTVDRSILFLDTPTDIRGIYVPMTRGRERNDAYIVTPDDTTAVDVFADAITRNWIDQPAIARRAELAGTNHRPGLLDPATLRSMLDRQSQLTATIKTVNDDLKACPGQIQAAENARHNAAAEMQRLSTELQETFDYLAHRDRPLFRRGHEDAIATSRTRAERLADKVTRHAGQVDRHTATLTALTDRYAAARRLEPKCPAMRHELGELTSRLGDDRNVRTRIHRHDPTAHHLRQLGQRPKAGELRHDWDTAIGHLDQLQAAYPNESRRTSEPVTTYGTAHDRANTEAARHAQLRQQLEHDRANQLRPDHGRDRGQQGPSLGIGR